MIPISDSDLARRRLPVVNVGLLALNTLVFLYEFAFIGDETRFVYTFGLIPVELTSGEDFKVLCATPSLFGCPPQNVLDISTPGATWITLFTSMFIHGGPLHIGSNMLYLWVFGDNIEDMLGHIPYLIFYLIAGLAAAGAQIMVDTQSQVPMVGASGAIAGVLGASRWRRRRPLPESGWDPGPRASRASCRRPATASPPAGSAHAGYSAWGTCEAEGYALHPPAEPA